MRKVYLIRHGKPFFPNKKPCCLGSTDYPLSDLGRIEAARVGLYMKNSAVTGVYCSNLVRSRQTAEFIGIPETVAGLEELDAGVWDGLPFDEIKKRWPAYYELRGDKPATYPPIGGEPFKAGAVRFENALKGLMKRTEGDIAVVSHAGVSRAFLCRITGMDPDNSFSIPQPYGGVSELLFDGKTWSPASIGRLPDIKLSYENCLALLKAASLPPEAIRHAKAVEEAASELAFQMVKSGKRLNMELITAASLLHDIARPYPNHAEEGGEWLRRMGYEEIANIVSYHHDLRDFDTVTEREIVYLADKLTLGDRRVPLRERFMASKEKCSGYSARLKHAERWKMALKVQQAIKKYVQSAPGNS